MRLRAALKRWIHERVPGLRGFFPYYGTRVYFPPESLIFRQACEQGVYAHGNLKLLLSLVRPGSWCFDVGANIGLLSVPLLASRPECRVLSIEPSPETFASLRRTHAGSAHRDRWRILGAAAGGAVGEVEFFVFPGGRGAYDGTRDTARGGKARTVRVPSTTLDGVWEELGRPEVSVIKIDVEGGELDVLEGAAHLIREQRPAILLEINAVNLRAYSRDPCLYLGYARRHGYALLGSPGLVPVTTGGALLAQLLRADDFLLHPEPQAAHREETG